MTLDDKFTAGAVEATEDCVGHESDEDLVRMYEPEGAGPRFALQQPERPEPAPSYELNGDVWKRPADSARGEAVVMCTGSLLYDRDLERTHTAGDVYEFRSLFSRVRACLESAALTIGSLRTVVVDEYHSLSTIPARYIDGQYSNAPSAYLDAIRYAGFDCLALAHAYNLDAGVRGVASTQRRVSEAGLVPSGLGTAKNPVFEVNGIRIGVLSFTVNASRADEWISAAGAERLLNIQTGSTMRRAVSEVRGAGAQFVLLYLDCRSEGTPLDLAARKQAAVAAAEAGADYVVCTRPPLVSRQLVHTTSDGRRVPIASGIGTFMAGPTNYIETPAAILRLILRTTDEGEIAVDDAYIPVRRFSLYRGVASPVVPDHPFYNPDYRAQDFDGAAETVAKKLGKAIRPDRSRTVTIDSDLRPQISPAEIADVLDTKFSRKVMRRLGSAFDAPVSIVAVQKEHLLPGSAAVLTPRTIAGVVPNRIRPEVPVAAGASMAIAKDPVPDVPTLVVDDPGAAFIRIATAIRERYRPLTVAVTGSAGKTTTMEMLAPIFERQMRTLMVKGNYNTPRGAARMIQKLSDDDEAYIQEVHGGSPGTASVASRMLSPDIAVITSIGDAHLQQLGTIEKVIEAKLQVIDGLDPGGTLIVNDDNEHLHAQHPPVRTLRCSRTDENCDFVARNIVQHEDGVEFDVVHPDGTTAVAVRSRGLHNVSNALLAFATARTAGVPAATIVAGLSRYRTRSVRQNLVEVGGYRLFVDAYNSNPLSLRSAVSTMCEMPVRDGARRIAVLGDMGEQGTQAAENHKAVGEFIADSRVDLVLCHGEGMAHTAAALQATGRPVRHAASPEDLIIDVRDHVRPGDLVLFKAAGSVDLVKTVVYPVFGKVV